MNSIDLLLSLPPQMSQVLTADQSGGACAWRDKLQQVAAGRVFQTSDPKGQRLGSGGGTVHLLWQAWQEQTGGEISIREWLRQSQKIVLHAGGESRRLPAYASVGKCFLPLPDGLGDPHPDFRPCLLDKQVPFYQRALEEAGEKTRVMVTSGDVWLLAQALGLPSINADITGLGMRVSPEAAKDFGVFLAEDKAVNREAPPWKVDEFLQKPSPARLTKKLRNREFFVDTGLWFLSEEAVMVLFRACGWQPKKRSFSGPDGRPANFDLYGEMGEALGRRGKVSANLQRAGFGKLTREVFAPEKARFLHLGSSRQLIESLVFLQNQETPQPPHFFIASPRRKFCLAEGDRTAPVWVESSSAPRHGKCTLLGWNVVTGLPHGHNFQNLPPELCLDVLPAKEGRWIFRFYGIDDSQRGTVSRGGKILGQAARQWLKAHRAPPEITGEIYDLPVFPMVSAESLEQSLLDWLIDPSSNPAVADVFWKLPRVSAGEIADQVDLAGWLDQREKAFTTQMVSSLVRAEGFLPGLDAAALLRWTDLYPALRKSLRETLLTHQQERRNGPRSSLMASRECFLAAGLLPGSKTRETKEEGRAILRRAILAEESVHRSHPTVDLKEDQIVWARSPARLDLAGGWSDTPPFCLGYGGRVLNMAVFLNGQPPIQAFARFTEETYLRVRSIDVGSALTVRTWKELEQYRDPSSPFSLPLAALALAGFHPDFRGRGKFSSLKEHLNHLGCGVEITMLCAIPKGSGLGTSSILGATLLAALNRACGLGWDTFQLHRKVLAMEQVLTTGGGWQDQAGALYPGLKLIETSPGLEQVPVVRFLPDRYFGPDRANRTVLLYYTGITRLAKNILQDIVDDMFLGESTNHRILSDIKENAKLLAEALQREDGEEIIAGIRRSWRLNCQLDAGTTNEAIARLLASLGEDLAAAKLLGAGGGGYILLFARNGEAGTRIRRKLEKNPPNSRARFVDFTPANRGLHVTVS
ncbi:MAG: hypothetical protein LAT55_09720 [Opitutales bacterium]|nr:hypothetical protein [Opitutales bacterium]